eukprot:CAMPEP_0173202754 /NCGR_PEP_ID=MMETSP1141-20130122/19143_1 /TAXON_ID=483371 /ORGANISM="non described non described, Strain CCMP2298" /LENGTH=121 /DNA_ID=CAMNT_0014128143 /DNA_START=116 /DNA_END=481 /DNA_ORIENTATION=-
MIRHPTSGTETGIREWGFRDYEAKFDMSIVSSLCCAGYLLPSSCRSAQTPTNSCFAMPSASLAPLYCAPASKPICPPPPMPMPICICIILASSNSPSPPMISRITPFNPKVTKKYHDRELT